MKFDTYCGGFGYLREDLNLDCTVNFLDFAILAEKWMEENVAYEYDLLEDGVVDEGDVMAFADKWLNDRNWENWER